MAGRKIKTGLDYFPHDVDLSNDPKVEALEAEFGHVGFAVMIKLLERIYRQGYFLEFGKDDQLIFAKRMGLDPMNFEAILKCCLNRGIFNRSIFEKHSVLSSSGIQKRYLMAVEKRKLNSIGKYDLISVSEMPIDSESMPIHSTEICIHSTEMPISSPKVRKEGRKEVKEGSNVSAMKAESFEMITASLLYDLILQDDPKAKQPNLQLWAADFDKLKRIDKRTEAEIMSVMLWARSDPFWKSNILSPSKLRSKFTQLLMQMNRLNNQAGNGIDPDFVIIEDRDSYYRFQPYLKAHNVIWKSDPTYKASGWKFDGKGIKQHFFNFKKEGFRR